MAKNEQYLTYEQVLQELQVNRSQLNQLIREGRLREHLVDGETKFRLVEARDVKKVLGKRPTVMEEGEAKEPTTDVLEEGAGAKRKEPKTEVIGDEGEKAEGERATELIEEEVAKPLRERDTELLEEELAGEDFGLEAEVPEEEARKPLADESGISETALDTELELKATGAAQKKEKESEEFFDFGAEGQELELAESPAAPAKPKAPAPKAEAPAKPAGAAKPAAAPPKKEEEEEMVTDILSLGAEEEVPEEDLLSEIMDIDEEQAAAKRAGTGDETEDVTAEITTIEEPTYEESGLGEVLEGEPGAAAEEAGAAPEFEIPVGEPVAPAEASVGALPIVLLAISLAVMIFAGIFVIENAMRPDLATGLTSWVPVGK